MSTETAAFRGYWRHFLLVLELNFRSKQALAYGYLVPVLFLVAFGGVFRAEIPMLQGQMGQLLTITILGGACFGMPTALVAERERGIWRRYRLLPVRTFGLVGGVLGARLVLIASSACLQVVLARLLYGTPFPDHPLQECAGVALVALSFMGLGLLIAGVASDVPAVQALGQCVFLPMIMIGGVGIPLLALPVWAQRVSGFMPGRYAVDFLQLGYSDPAGSGGGAFSAAALCVIGAAAACAGWRLFRWDPGMRLGRAAWTWTLGALAAWLAVGLAAGASGRLAVPPAHGGYAAVTQDQIDSIAYADLPGDGEFVSRLAPAFGAAPLPQEVKAFSEELEAWPPGRGADAGRDVRNLLCVAAIADAGIDAHEGEIARLVFGRLRRQFGDERLGRLLAWVILYPDEGQAITAAPELGLPRQIREDVVRQRTVLYARKFLGRLLGKIPD